MPFHLIREEDIKEEHICPYCKADVKEQDRDSIFHCSQHYKEIECSCGKTLHFKVDFDGSGHDHLTENNKKKEGRAKEATSNGVKTIESRIKLLEPT